MCSQTTHGVLSKGFLMCTGKLKSGLLLEKQRLSWAGPVPDLCSCEGWHGPLCLSYYCIAVKKHHEQDNCYKRKHVVGACLQFQTKSVIIMMGRMTEIMAAVRWAWCRSSLGLNPDPQSLVLNGLLTPQSPLLGTPSL